jgi:hypothetical protein
VGVQVIPTSVEEPIKIWEIMTGPCTEAREPINFIRCERTLIGVKTKLVGVNTIIHRCE